MTWLHPERLWLLLPVWGLLAVAERSLRGRRRRLRAVWHQGSQSAPETIRSGLVAGAVTAVILALAGPALSAGSAHAENAGAAGGADGEDVLLVLDVSRSMSARDVAPSRGQVARMAALRLATATSSDRVGVAAFAADAYVLVPPTGDRGLVALYVESLDADAVSGQGSDLARALDVAVSALTKGGIAVLLSDGEGFQDPAELDRVARRARDAGVVVHTVLVGTEAGADVPGVLTGGRSAADPKVMARIAAATGGQTVDGRDGPAVARLVAALARGRRGGGAPQPSGSGIAHLFALAALILLLAEPVVGAATREGVR